MTKCSPFSSVSTALSIVALANRMGAYLDSKPVYGLIFLFRWREDDPNKQEASCPDGVWFANQVSFDPSLYALDGCSHRRADGKQCLC